LFIIESIVSLDHRKVDITTVQFVYKR